MRTLLQGGTIVNEGRSYRGSLVINDDRIEDIIENAPAPRGDYDKTVDATGCYVLPGIIDEHVHFREPGLTQKADIESESRAAAYGGVTTFFDMPNCVPQTTTLEALADKFTRAERSSHVNYSFFFGATNNNVALFSQLDPTRIPGIKLFMGASTGNMLVDQMDALHRIFAACADLDLPLMTHCEDSGVIAQNMQRFKFVCGEDPDVRFHFLIRDEEACYRSTALAVKLALQHHTRLHVAHLTTARELQLFEASDDHYLPQITAEAVIAHLWFTAGDTLRLGARIKCNPSVKMPSDRDALRRALSDGRIATVGTDHAPHEWSKKQGGCARAASGMPMLQFSLPAMLQLVDAGVLGIEKLVTLMCHHPAMLFSVCDRGFLRKGYKADVTVVKPHSPWTVTPAIIQSKCGWSPMEGERFDWQVRQTYCNGRLVYDQGHFDESSHGEAVRFRKKDNE